MQTQSTAQQYESKDEKSGSTFPDRDTNPAIVVQNVTVSYRAYNQRPTSLKQSVIAFVKGSKEKSYSTFDALKNVSFTIQHGEVFGILGSNGSGKSTLLKVISGVLRATKGNIVRLGSISSLIELGAGFDPELTAVENIYLNGSLHGKSREQIKPRIQDILDFAELNDFAYTPVKYFSSGMYTRLGFSAAIDIDPEILIVDEILSVGDERFQKKCAEVFASFVEQQKTIIFVSHDLGMIESMCTRACVLSKGQVTYIGEVAEAIRKYRDPAYESALHSSI
jgi:ABC-type polysaccharide/polyol phosphate transport system ATPase subunit